MHGHVCVCSVAIEGSYVFLVERVPANYRISPTIGHLRELSKKNWRMRRNTKTRVLVTATGTNPIEIPTVGFNFVQLAHLCSPRLLRGSHSSLPKDSCASLWYQRKSRLMKPNYTRRPRDSFQAGLHKRTDLEQPTNNS